MNPPPALLDFLTGWLGEPPRDIRSVGASMSSAARFHAGGTSYLVKWTNGGETPPDGWPGMLAAEARGLALLASAQAVRIPDVYTSGEAEGGALAYLVMEWIEPDSRADRQKAGALLGERLAAQHRVGAEAFGLDHNNYCGATPQDNRWMNSWVVFYGQRRLGFQMDLAAQRGLMPAERRRRLERLIERLGQWLPEPAQPSLLHGDLWGGNWLIAAGGEPAIIDPAVFFGDREAELAMCHLFGGFPASFFAAYDAAWPPDPGRDERMPLYQLYHLLNHLNLFGEAYGIQVDAVLRRYVG
ncbi:MAG: fructosamine kinase [Herpetosiphonaceae bacterium]|nr:MAG: fructosamine kinase [Herpetosiphonaceae bacterium]